MKIFVDTNIYLDFYRSSLDSLNILDELMKVNASVIVVDQVINEFKRNRINLLSNLLINFKKQKRSGHYHTSFVNEVRQIEELKLAGKQYDKIFNKVCSNINDIIVGKGIDPVLKKMEAVFSSVQLVVSSDADLERAKKRDILGAPPRSDGKKSICDQLIWEAILANLRDDLVVVSRDATYSQHYSLLKEEYLKITGKNLVCVVEKISKALTKIGEDVSPVVKKAETAQVRHIIKASTSLAAVGTVTHYGIGGTCAVCGTEGRWNGVVCTACGHMCDD